MRRALRGQLGVLVIFGFEVGACIGSGSGFRSSFSFSFGSFRLRCGRVFSLVFSLLLLLPLLLCFRRCRRRLSLGLVLVRLLLPRTRLLRVLLLQRFVLQIRILACAQSNSQLSLSPRPDHPQRSSQASLGSSRKLT